MITALSSDELKAASILADTIIAGIKKLEIRYNRLPEKEEIEREFVLGLLVAFGEDVKAE
jgi:hypothetical protein